MPNPLYLTIDSDPDAECPSDEDGWKLYSFNTRHDSFKHPRELGLGMQQTEDGLPTPIPIGLRKKLSVGLAFFLGYFEHGNCLWFLRDDGIPSGCAGDFRWDGNLLAGLLVWEQPARNMGAKTPEARAEDARAFLKSYTAWANGDGLIWTLSEDPDENDGWNSASDLDDAMAGVEDELKGFPGRPIVVDGDAADLVLSYHKIAGRVMVGSVEDLEGTEAGV